MTENAAPKRGRGRPPKRQLTPGKQAGQQAADPGAPRWMTYSEAERRTGKSQVTLWRWIKKGTFPAPRKHPNGSVLFRVEDIEAWEAGLPVQTYKAEHAAA